MANQVVKIDLEIAFPSWQEERMMQAIRNMVNDMIAFTGIEYRVYFHNDDAVACELIAPMGRGNSVVKEFQTLIDACKYVEGFNDGIRIMRRLNK